MRLKQLKMSGDIFLIWSGILGLSPFFKKSTNSFKRKNWYLIWTTILQITLFTLQICCRYQADGTLNGFDTIQVILLNFILIYTTFKLCLWKLTDLQWIFEKFKTIDGELKSVHGLSVLEFKYMGSVFVAVNIFITLPCLYTDVFWMLAAEDARIIYAQVAETVQTYNLHFQAFFQMYILNCIQLRFSVVNQVTKNLHGTLLKPSKLEETIESLLNLHINLYTVITKFNNLFGWNIFLQIVLFFAMGLNNIYGLLKDLGSKDAKYAIDSSILILINVVQIIVFSAKCESLSNETDVALENASIAVGQCKNKEVRTHLSHLIQQIHSRQPNISAAGFFNVNFSTVFMLFNLVVTYTIAIFQFLPSPFLKGGPNQCGDRSRA